MKRREFLLYTAGFAASGALASTTPPKVGFAPNPQLGIDDHHWRVIDRTLDHLFPSETQAPGAADVHATAWLHNALLMPEVDDGHRRFMRDGALLLEETGKRVSGKSFVELDFDDRERVLREMETHHDGKAWLRESLRYILEALLSDPVYGGNTNESGWKWLQHRPGFPRPPKNKRYFLL